MLEGVSDGFVEIQLPLVDRRRHVDRELHQLVEGVLAVGGQALHQGRALGRQVVIGRAAKGVLVAEAGHVELGLLDRRHRLGGGPAHEFGIAREGQVVLTPQDVGDLRAVGRAEILARPACQMALDAGDVRIGLVVERHVEEELGQVLARLDIADIDDPQPPRVVLVGLVHLLPHQGGMGVGQPQVRHGITPVRDVVVDARPARALALLGVAQPADIAVVVVRPIQRDVVGHLQAGIIGGQHLLVGREHLRDLVHRLLQLVAQHPALLGEHLLQRASLVLRGVGALHRTVLDAAHPDRVHVVVLAPPAHGLAPVVHHPLAVLEDVVGPHRLDVPLADVGARDHFGVRAGPNQAIGLRHLGVAGDLVERLLDAAHARPEGVGLQPPHQLVDPGVGLGSDVTQLRVVGLRGPRIEAEFLVVEEDATVLHRGRLGPAQVAVDRDVVDLTDLDVGPPFPGRDAHLARQVHHAPDRSARVGAEDQQGRTAVRQGHLGAAIGLPLAGEAPGVQVVGLQQGGDGRRSGQAEDHHGSLPRRLAGHDGRLAGQGREVVGQQLCGLAQRRGLGVVIDDGRRGLAVEQGQLARVARRSQQRRGRPREGGEDLATHDGSPTAGPGPVFMNSGR